MEGREIGPTVPIKEIKHQIFIVFAIFLISLRVYQLPLSSVFVRRFPSFNFRDLRTCVTIALYSSHVSFASRQSPAESKQNLQCRQRRKRVV